MEKDKNKAGMICQKMLERNLFETVLQQGTKSGLQKRKFNVNNLYRFFMDRDDIADNQHKKFKNKPGDPVEVSKNLINLISEVYQVAIVEDDEEEEASEQEQILDIEHALQSQEYKKYINACSELELLDLISLNDTQKVAFFLNVY